MDEKIVSLLLKDNTIIIKLTNEAKKEVFMRYSYDKNSQLIFTETDTFKKYWSRNVYDEYSTYASANSYELRQDYKFKYAEEGFSRGYKDPVPIARISLLNHTALPSIGLNNGITRTIWLIANSYKIIPFEISNVTSDFLLDKGVYEKTLKDLNIDKNTL